MKITVTTTSTKLSSLLSASDLALFNSFYQQSGGAMTGGGGGGIVRNDGSGIVYIENGKDATTTDSFYLYPPTGAYWDTWFIPGDALSIGFLRNAEQVYLRTNSGTATLRILF